MTTRTLTATRPGPITIDAHLLNHAGTITVRATPRCTRATITIRTPEHTGPAADAIRTATLRQDGHTLLVRVLGQAGTTIVNGSQRGVTIIQNAGIVTGTLTGLRVDGDTITAGDIHINGTRAVAGDTLLAQPAPITIEALLPEHSSVTARTNSADINVDGPMMDTTLASDSGDLWVGQGFNTYAKTKSGAIVLGRTAVAEAETRSGDITIRSACGTNLVSSRSGDIKAHAIDECSITADSRSGDITVTATPAAIASGLTVRTSTTSGRVRTPRR